MKSKIMEKEIIKFEEALKALKKPELSEDLKGRMRRDILLRINEPFCFESKYPSIERVKRYIGKVARITEPSVFIKSKIKENVLTFVENNRLGSNFVWGIARSWQKVIATFMVGVISMCSFTVYFAGIPVTKAAKKTVFHEVYGDVDVVRDGEYIKASKYMELWENDIVSTGENGLAVIRYFDDSVSRLSPLTELKMQRLYQDQNIRAKTKVEVELTRGRVWSQVVNLVEEQSSFEVYIKSVKTRSSGKASFDINHNDDLNKTSVAVFENKVEVIVPEKRKENKKVVIEGYSVEVYEDESIKEKKAYMNDNDDLWIAVNKAEDKQYKKVVDKEKDEESKKDAGFLPTDALYSAKKINESTKLLVTTDKVSKNKIKVDIAVKRLDEASALLVGGNEDGATKQLEDFYKIIDEISAEIGGSDEIKEYIQYAFADKEKDLSTVLPDGKRYKAKEALRTAKLKLAITGEEKNQVSLKSATEKVVEAKELFGEEKQEHAQLTLLEAAKEIVDISSTGSGSDGGLKTVQQKEQTLSTVRVLKGLVEKDEEINVEVKMIIDATEQALEKPLETVEYIDSDSAIVIDIEEETKVQLKEGQE